MELRIVDDMRFTVSHVVETVERGIAKINRAFHQISENVRRFQQQMKTTKDVSRMLSFEKCDQGVRKTCRGEADSKRRATFRSSLVSIGPLLGLLFHVYM